LNKIGVFCGSNLGKNSIFISAAKELAKVLVNNNLSLVYGGGRLGLMGEIADQMLQLNGNVTGVIPKTLVEKERAHLGIPDLRIVDSMHERKALMAELSDGFIAMPGGIGTLDEFFEIWTWAQIGLHKKPCAILNINNYFDDLIKFLNKAVDEKFLLPVFREMILIEDNPSVLINRMKNYEAPDRTI
jgi:hypothetical protein